MMDTVQQLQFILKPQNPKTPNQIAKAEII